MAIGGLRLSVDIFNRSVTIRRSQRDPAVLTEKGRASRIGFELDFKHCDE
jgi:hypothetical protein